MIKRIMANFINAINNYDGSDEAKEQLKNHICYISENKSMFTELYPVEELLHDASLKLKVFGYDKMNNISKLEQRDEIHLIVDDALKEYHKSSMSTDKEEIILDGMQKNIVDRYQQLEKRRIIVSAPTSFGKSYILQEILVNNKEEYKNVMLILPTIALLNENVNKYQKIINKKLLDYTIVSSNYEEINFETRNMFIFTPERALRFLGRYASAKIDFFFFDEVYKIEERLDFVKDDQSGEEKITSSDKRSTAFRTALYLLSNMVKDFYIAGPYLDFESTNSKGLKKYLEKHNVEKFKILFDPTLRISYEAWRKSEIIENNVLTPETMSYKSKIEQTNQEQKLIRIKRFIDEHDKGKTIFYVNYPSLISKLLKNQELFNVQPLKNKELEQFISHLKSKYNVKMPNGLQSVDYWTLIKCLEFGIGVHHGKMPKYIQNEILRQFNKKDGLTYLFCTSTIIEGVNTVAKNVVMISESIGNGDMKKFAFKNIKGRTGRYYTNFVGNIFYCTPQQKQMDDTSYMHLEFLNFGDNPLLATDLDNTEKIDLSSNNSIEKTKRESKYDKNLLPDDVFYQNRLFDRLEQEKVLNKIIADENKFNELYTLTQKVLSRGRNFLELLSEILDLEEDLLLDHSFNKKTPEERKEILSKYKYKIISVLRSYERDGFVGLLKYEINRPQNKPNLLENMDKNYNYVFDEIRTIIEYDVPKYISLYQSLFAQACLLKNKTFENNELDEFIKYYEIGSSNDFSQLLIERGFPSESAKDIDVNLKKTKINFLNNDEVIDYIDTNQEIISNLDDYEKNLYKRIIDLYKNE